MPIKVVFFDMGETLCHQKPPTPEIMRAFLDGKGIALEPRALRLAYLAAMTYFSDWAMRVDVAQRTNKRRDEMVDDFYRVMMLNLGLSSKLGLIPELRKAVVRQGERHFNAVFPDVWPALDALRGRNLRLGIISNWDHSLTDVVHRLGFTPYMDVVVSSANVGIEKPNTGIFDVALARMGVAPDEACHVGDIYYMDVLGARCAGITPVLIDRHRLQLDVDCLRTDCLTQLPSLLDEVQK